MGLVELLGNAPDIGMAGRYAGILGERPSQGARSPLLWNAVFEAEELDIRFHPFDLTSERLADVVDALKADQRFIGGSVTFPHKAAVLPLLDRVEPLAEMIGAVNALYRDGDALVGANTDGAGALHSVLDLLGDDALGAHKVVQCGVGGAGMAVAAYLADSLDGGELLLANRDRAKALDMAKRLRGRVRAVEFPPSASDLEGADLVVNCTSLGFATPGDAGVPHPARAMTPLGPTTEISENVGASVAALRASKPHALVFDIVYQPRDTMLLTLAAALGRQVLDGLAMNREQAVIAFAKAVPGGPDADRVRAVMAAVL